MPELVSVLMQWMNAPVECARADTLYTGLFALAAVGGAVMSIRLALAARRARREAEAQQTTEPRLEASSGTVEPPTTSSL